MKNVLYIGNNLRRGQSNLSYISVLGPLLEREGFEVAYSSAKEHQLLRLLEMIWQTFKMRSQVGIVLIDTYSTRNFYYAFLVSQLCRFLKLKYVTLLHGGKLPDRLDASPKLSNLIFKYAYLNVCPSQYMEDIFRSKGFENLVFIPNIIEIKRYPYSKRDIVKPRLFWVRSFVSIYNPLLALKVFNLLKNSYLNPELCMIGPEVDDSFKVCQNFAEKHQIEFVSTGKLEKSEWIELSKDYNIFINTTNIDNMPVSVIEAMALGLPVVSTNVGGMPYLIENGVDGLLVPPNDAPAMAEAIEWLMQDSQLRNRIIENARKKVEQFDWDVIKHQWIKILEG